MITEQEAINRGMKDWEIVIGIINDDIIQTPGKMTPMEKQHGKVVDFRQEPYHDVTVYEDGYEDWCYIGD